MIKNIFKKTKERSPFYRLAILSKKIIGKDNSNRDYFLSNNFLYLNKNKRNNQQKHVDFVIIDRPVDTSFDTKSTGTSY